MTPDPATEASDAALIAPGQGATLPRPGTALPSLSIIVVSRHRPDHLRACLAALAQQDHPNFEIILVADPQGAAVAPDLRIKRIPFDEANISAARNAGIALAAGEVIAFIDDDALALPHWGRLLAVAFTDPEVIAATGFTRGPDGYHWQARAERITRDGLTRPMLLSGAAAFASEAGEPVSTIGTNCAFRACALREIGGFDPLFPYHLDESDVNLRLAARFPDALTAICPRAEVIHGAAAGPARASSGVPSDLRPIGRSTGFFTRKHGGRPPDLDRIQRQRLLRLMVAGRLDPFALKPLLDGLKRGLREGGESDLPPPPAPLPDPRAAFQPFAPPAQTNPPLILSGWYWQRRKLRRRAAAEVAGGRIVCLLLWTPTILPHRLAFAGGGWWEGTGGIWGAAGEETGLFSQLIIAPRRRMAEIERAAFCRFDAT